MDFARAWRTTQEQLDPIPTLTYRNNRGTELIVVGLQILGERPNGVMIIPDGLNAQPTLIHWQNILRYDRGY